MPKTLIKRLTVPEALAEADLHRGGGRDRLREIVEMYGADGDLGLWTFGEDDEEELLDVAWQEIDATRLLTPREGPRTLRAVANHVVRDFGSFENIVCSRGVPGFLEPHWFDRCAEIERGGFDWDNWTRPWLVPAKESERRFSPSTSLYAWEGVHSLAVLATGLVNNSILWVPVEAVICDKRPP